MRITRLLLAALAVASSVACRHATTAVVDDAQAKVRLILDTDMDSDCDDPAALAVLHALADAGEVEPLAIMISALDPHAGPCADAINTYYGRPDLPIGSARPPAVNQKSKYTKAVADRC